jgi:hypothetical protein
LLLSIHPWIKIAIKQNKLAHKQWKEAGKPKRPEHPLFLRKVETRKIYRTEIRKEESKRIVPDIQFKFVFSILSLVRALFGRIIKYFHSFFYSLS